MSGKSGLTRALLLKPPAARPPPLVVQFPSPPLHLSSPGGGDLIHSTLPVNALPAGFYLLPRFFNLAEQQTLLSAALQRLDRIGGVRRKNGPGGGRRKLSKTDAQARKDRLMGLGEGLEGWFMDEADYKFEQGHMDSVTHQYREALLSSPLPPPSSHSTFASTPNDLLKRLHFLFPTPATPDASASPFITDGGKPEPRIQTHLLHLAREGWIGGHVDSKESMGDVLVGVCLGGDRVLRLERDPEAPVAEGTQPAEGRIDVLLESGTVYIQSGEVRNDFKHSLLPPKTSSAFPKEQPPAWEVPPRQRLSIILRDLPPSTAVSNITTDPLSPAFYNPLGPSLPLAHDPLSSTDELHLAFPPEKAARIECAIDRALDPKYEVYAHTLSKSEQRYARRTRNGSEVTNAERVKQGMRNRKWGGK